MADSRVAQELKEVRNDRHGIENEILVLQRAIGSWMRTMRLQKTLTLLIRSAVRHVEPRSQTLSSSDSVSSMTFRLLLQFD